MKTFNQFTKNTRSVSNDLASTLKYLQVNCQQALRHYRDNGYNLAIYRGKRPTSDFTYIDPRSSYRPSSAGTQATHNIILDNLDSWQKAPSRSKGIIAGDYNAALGFVSSTRVMHCIFPIDNTPIAICSGPDILHEEKGFTHLYKNYYETLARGDCQIRVPLSIESFDSNLKYIQSLLCDKYSEYMVDLSPTNFDLWCQQFDKLLQKEGKIDLATKASYSFNLTVKAINDTYQGNFQECLDKILNFDANGFKVVNNISQLDFKDAGEGHEIWFSNPCVMIISSLLNPDFIQQLNNLVYGN